MRQARLGADEGLTVIAARQTAGRGRHGRVFFSEAGSGLYFSMVLRPSIDPRQLSLITLMAGIAVYDAVSELGIKSDIKWVNDVLAGGRKIAGILAEAGETPKGLAVILGIGINLRSSNFPPELSETATSIEEETRVAVTAEDLSQILTKYLSYFYEILSGSNGADEIIGHWRRRSTYFSGKMVTVTMDGRRLLGTTDGLVSDGALRLRLADGSVEIIQAGDVERLRAD